MTRETILWTGRWAHWKDGEYFSEVHHDMRAAHNSILNTWFLPEDFDTQAKRTKCLAKIYRKGVRVVKVRLVAVNPS